MVSRTSSLFDLEIAGDIRYAGTYEVTAVRYSSLPATDLALTSKDLDPDLTVTVLGFADGTELFAELSGTASLTGDWGEHKVTVMAKDLAGNPSEAEVPFIYDPDPPALSWGAEGDAGALGVLEAESAEAIAAARRDLRGHRRLRVGKVDWQVDSDLAQIRLRPQTRKPIRLAGLGSIGHRQGLWVLADDKVCRDLTNLAYTLVEGAGEGDYVLWAKAVDCVGNTIVSQLPLTRESKRK